MPNVRPFSRMGAQESKAESHPHRISRGWHEVKWYRQCNFCGLQFDKRQHECYCPFAELMQRPPPWIHNVQYEPCYVLIDGKARTFYYVTIEYKGGDA